MSGGSGDSEGGWRILDDDEDAPQWSDTTEVPLPSDPSQAELLPGWRDEVRLQIHEQTGIPLERLRHAVLSVVRDADGTIAGISLGWMQEK